jgi:predicted ATPase
LRVQPLRRKQKSQLCLSQNGIQPGFGTKVFLFPRVTDGFFLRAESFFNFATYIDEVEEDDPGLYGAYGGKSLHAQSHGEAFLALFKNKFKKGIYLLDEPEAALSPKRQLSFLVLIHELEKKGIAQFIIATHSPILLSYPEAVIFSFDGGCITPMAYEETEHYQITRGFFDESRPVSQIFILEFG